MAQMLGYGVRPALRRVGLHHESRVMPDGRLSLPAELRRRHGLAKGGEVMLEDTGDAIVLRTVDQVVARAQALSQKLVGSKNRCIG
jgi:AbrB family looped-hinge helix DNA binding protein